MSLGPICPGHRIVWIIWLIGQIAAIYRGMSQNRQSKGQPTTSTYPTGGTRDGWPPKGIPTTSELAADLATALGAFTVPIPHPDTVQEGVAMLKCMNTAPAIQPLFRDPAHTALLAAAFAITAGTKLDLVLVAARALWWGPELLSADPSGLPLLEKVKEPEFRPAQAKDPRAPDTLAPDDRLPDQPTSAEDAQHSADDAGALADAIAASIYRYLPDIDPALLNDILAATPKIAKDLLYRWHIAPTVAGALGLPARHLTSNHRPSALPLSTPAVEVLFGAGQVLWNWGQSHNQAQTALLGYLLEEFGTGQKIAPSPELIKTWRQILENVPELSAVTVASL